MGDAGRWWVPGVAGVVLAILVWCVGLAAIGRMARALHPVPPGERGSYVACGSLVAFTREGAEEVRARVRVGEGALAGQEVVARCREEYVPLLHPGDACLVRVTDRPPDAPLIALVGPVRDRALLGLACVFLGSAAAAMGWRGLRIVGSLALAGVLVLGVFLPLAIRGWPPLLLAAMVAVPVCVGGILLIGGANRKSLHAMAGCLAALVAAAWFPIVLSRRIALTGLEVGFGTYWHLSVPLWYNATLARVDFFQLLLSGMILAGLGATMDVAMTIATATSEFVAASPDAQARRVLRAGLSVGKDIIGMMAISIILIAAGSQFEMLLLVHLRGLPEAAGRLLNYEGIAAEALRVMAGALALSLAAPFTAAIAALDQARLCTRSNETERHVP